jgi:hypothetical protein
LTAPHSPAKTSESKRKMKNLGGSVKSSIGIVENQEEESDEKVESKSKSKSSKATSK